MLDTEGVREESVFSRLTSLRDTGFELTLRGGNHEDGTVSLGGSCDHILDEVSVTWGINDGEVIFGGFELPERNINGDTSFSFALELVHNPGVFEGRFSEISGFLLILFDGSLIDTTTFVDEMSGGCGFSGVDVTDDDEVDVSLITFLWGHCCCLMNIKDIALLK